MKDTRDWDEAYVQWLIDECVRESLNLEYKGSAGLANSEGNKREISKDVSAFANSAGGVILYGVEEDKHVPTQIDAGFDPRVTSKEWIEQVVNSSIHPKIDNLQINQILLSSRGDGKVIYAIDVPAATHRAPHQAKDNRYYKRYNYQSVPMEDYEVRDLFRRASTPELYMDLSFSGKKSAEIILSPNETVSKPIELVGTIRNRSREPALYTLIQFFVDKNLLVRALPGFAKQPDQNATIGDRSVDVFARIWKIPENMPIFQEVALVVLNFSFSISENYLHQPQFPISYVISAPGFYSLRTFLLENGSTRTLTISEVSGRTVS